MRCPSVPAPSIATWRSSTSEGSVYGIESLLGRDAELTTYHRTVRFVRPVDELPRTEERDAANPDRRGQRRGERWRVGHRDRRGPSLRNVGNAAHVSCSD